MANDVQYLIDMLYEMIDGAKGVLMSPDKCIIVREDALDLLDELKGQLPLELKKAQDLIRARDEFVDSAKKEAEKIRRQADGRQDHRGRERDHPGRPGQGPRHPPPGGGAQQGHGHRHQRVHRRRPAADGGGAADGAGGAAGVPGRFRAVSNEQLQAQRAKLEAQASDGEKRSS